MKVQRAKNSKKQETNNMKKPAIPDIKIYWKAVRIKTVYLYKEERTVKEKKEPRN